MPSNFLDVAHLLRRSGFGGSRVEIEALSALEWTDIVDQILDTSPNPPITANVPNLNPDTTGWSERYIGITHHWFERARTVPRPIQEKMTLFWHGLLCSGLDKVGQHYMMFDQIQLFRAAGMGDIVSLYQAMAVQPAMLMYLDNKDNTKSGINENFAREVMELFTLGQGHYTEDDVAAAALAWTGHGLTQYETYPRTYVYRADRHDDSMKTFMGVTANWDGPDTLNHILLGPKQRDAARFISAKMWSFFAYPNPETALVEDLAEVMVSSGMRADAVLRAIFNRPEFLSEKARQGLVRSPFEFTVAALRHAELITADIDPQWYIGEMGQSLYDPPNVSGWRQNGYWISSSAMWAKARFASNLRWRAFDNEFLADSSELAANESVSRALETFGVYEASSTTTDSLRNFVATERTTSRWAESPGLIFLSLLTPEFQLA